uniref:Peptidase S1 domain-containing protein n=1 Tax=Heterorhabditis bacteriophora TaxID=37862 RepID=A0A1I7WFH8_HETBA
MCIYFQPYRLRVFLNTGSVTPLQYIGMSFYTVSWGRGDPTCPKPDISYIPMSSSILIVILFLILYLPSKPNTRSHRFSLRGGC